MRKRILLLTLVFGLFLHSCNVSSSEEDPTSSSITTSEVSSEEDHDANLASVATDKANLTLSNTTDLTSDIMLPSAGENATIISWHSSHPSSLAIVSLQTGVTVGQVTRQASAVTGITLTATISKGQASDTKAFTASVAALSEEPDPSGEFNVLTIATKRVWLKVTSATWNSDAQTYIHYFNGTSPETPWPGVPLLSDAANDAYYYDLPEDINGYMFTRVDQDGNYLNAKTSDLSYANSLNQLYTITGAVSGSGERTIAGSYSAFTAQTTTIVAAFVALMNNITALNDFNVAVRELNYYYHGLTSYERIQFDYVTLSDGVTGKERVENLIATHNLAGIPIENFTQVLHSDRDTLTLPATVSNSFDLVKFASSGSLVTWSSSNEALIKIVNYRALVSPPATSTSVTLTATLTFFNEKVTYPITLNVIRDASVIAVTVTWTVNLPAAIPDGRTLTMGANENAWTPSNPTWGTVSRVNDTRYTFTKEFVKTGATNELPFSYKWVLYSASDTNQWYGVELIANNANRDITLSFDHPTQSFTDTVSSWENDLSGSNGSSTVAAGDLTVTTVNGRTIRIYTPANYNANDTSTKYPVIYMHDGQNVFDRATSFAGEWEVDEAIEALISSKGWGGAIAVGIDNTPNRMDEYMYPTGYISYSGFTPKGDVYMNLIVNEIKPYVDRNFNTLTDRANTVIGGSSMGGLISFFGGLHHLATFGTILAFSTSTQTIRTPEVNIPATLASLNAALLTQTKFFLYVGTAGDGDAMHPTAFQNYLRAADVPIENIQTYTGQGYGHNEPSWAKHFPIALSWTFGYGLPA